MRPARANAKGQRNGANATGRTHRGERNGAEDRFAVFSTAPPSFAPLLPCTLANTALSQIVGEVSSFVIRSDYGYNRCALPESLPKVKMNDTMIYEIELVSFGDAIPRFPSKEELDQTKKDRLEENKKFLEENPPVPYADRCSEAMKEKDLGNELFKKGDYEEAKKQYDSGFIHVYIHHDEWKSNMMNDEQRKMINDTKAILHLNRCMCRVKQEKWNDALWDADKAIEYGGKPGNPKAYYRRMVIYTGHFSRELAKEQDGKFWDIAKGQRWQRCGRLHCAS